MYYLAIGDDLSFANLDILPLTPTFLKIITTVLGDSIKAVHFTSALCGALSLLFACLITKKLGGRRYATMLTGLCIFFSGFLPFGALFTYDSLDFLIQVVAIYLLVRIVKEDNQRLWLLFGLVLGIGLLNKISILAFGLATFLSLWLVPQRVYFKSKWIWLAGIIALLFLTPFVIWQSQNNWYYLDFASGYAGNVAYAASFPEFLWNQILPNNIWGLPFWVTGLFLLLFLSKWKTFRLFGLMYIMLFFLFYFLGLKFYFLLPMYSILFAVGSIKVEEFLNTLDLPKKKITSIRLTIPVAYVILGLPLLPFLVPILPIENFVDYASILGVNAGVRTEASKYNQLPHHVADRFGWPEMVDQVAGVYNDIVTESQEKTGILTQSYGQASALKVLGRKYNLPKPISPYGWYYFETLRTDDFQEQYVSVGFSRDELIKVFGEVKIQGIFTHQYCLPQENNNPIYLCKNPKYDLGNYWKVFHNMNPRFLEIVREEGIAAAVDYYHQYIADNPSSLLFTEDQMNILGYEYFYCEMVTEALALFQLNVEAYPEAYNTYDSLGEAYMENEKYTLAIKNYKKSLELNPNNLNAKKKLEELAKLNNGIILK